MMCELLGICYAKPVVVDFSLRSFALRDVENAQGWGLAWYRGKSLAIAKEPLTWRESGYTSFLESYQHLKSHLFIGHVRKATIGGTPKRADSHPFSRELGGREYCFAHNGTVYGFDRLPLGRFTPIGDTDSEHVFCHLMSLIDQRSEELDDEPHWVWLHERFAEINHMGKFNCLMCDGERLFAYYDVNSHKSLHLCESPLRWHEPKEMSDAAIDVELTMDGEQPQRSVDPGVTIATIPLSDNPNWRPFAPGQLVVLQAGRVVSSMALPRTAAAAV